MKSLNRQVAIEFFCYNDNDNTAVAERVFSLPRNIYCVDCALAYYVLKRNFCCKKIYRSMCCTQHDSFV